LVKQKKGSAAHQVVQEAQIQLPEDQRALTLAQCYEALGDVGLADQFYLSALDNAPDDTSIQRAVASHYLRTNRPTQAETYLDKIVRAHTANGAHDDNYGWARRESAKLLAGATDYQQFLKAMDMLKPVNGVTPDSQDLSLKAALLSERNEPASSRQALQLLTTLGEQRPLVSLERLLRAQVQEHLGDWPAANSEMLSLVGQSKPTPTIYIAYVEMLLRNGSASEANRWLAQLKKIAPDAPEIPVLTARIDAALGRGAQAATMLKKQLPEQRPLPKEEWRHLLAIAGLLEQIKQYDEAEKLYREYISYAPQDSLVLARFLAERGKVDETIALVDQLRNKLAASPLLQVLLIAIRQSIAPPTETQMAAAEAFFDRALRDDPESSLVQIQVAGLREIQGQRSKDIKESQARFQEAEALYREVFVRLETRPIDRAVVANNLAYLLAIQGRQLDEAMKFVKGSMDFLGPKSDILDTRGLIYLAQGRTKDAIADFKEASLSYANPHRGSKLVHLALAQAADKKDGDAKATLNELKDVKFDPKELPPIERAKYDALLRQLGQQA
ncbi:MAG: hypothetical protein IT427_05975, partial [Pirellulales bacterium]|nr:hypothetical protein [Pirellulales bacterium]